MMLKQFFFLLSYLFVNVFFVSARFFFSSFFQRQEVFHDWFYRVYFQCFLFPVCLLHGDGFFLYEHTVVSALRLLAFNLKD